MEESRRRHFQGADSMEESRRRHFQGAVFINGFCVVDIIE